MDASELLPQLLDHAKITQAEFADLAGVTVATVNRWANGHHLADARKLAKAITMLGRNPADYGIDLPSQAISNHQVVELLAAMREEQRRQHDETMTALSDLRIAVEVLRARS